MATGRQLRRPSPGEIVDLAAQDYLSHSADEACACTTVTSSSSRSRFSRPKRRHVACDHLVIVGTGVDPPSRKIRSTQRSDFATLWAVWRSSSGPSCRRYDHGDVAGA